MFEPIWLKAPRKPKVPCKKTFIPVFLLLGRVKHPDGYTSVCSTLVRNSAGHYGELVRKDNGSYRIRVKNGTYEGISYEFAREIDKHK